MTEEPNKFTLYEFNDQYVFYTEQKVWTLEELHHVATILKSFVQEEDIKGFKRAGRYDLLGHERVETWDVMKIEVE